MRKLFALLARVALIVGVSAVRELLGGARIAPRPSVSLQVATDQPPVHRPDAFCPEWSQRCVRLSLEPIRPVREVTDGERTRRRPTRRRARKRAARRRPSTEAQDHRHVRVLMTTSCPCSPRPPREHGPAQTDWVTWWRPSPTGRSSPRCIRSAIVASTVSGGRPVCARMLSASRSEEITEARMEARSSAVGAPIASADDTPTTEARDDAVDRVRFSHPSLCVAGRGRDATRPRPRSSTAPAALRCLSPSGRRRSEARSARGRAR